MNLRLQNWNDAKSQQGTKHVHKLPLEENWPYNHSEEKHFSSPFPFIPCTGFFITFCKSLCTTELRRKHHWNDPTLGAQQTPAVHQVHRVHCPSHGKDFPSKTRHLHRALEVNMLQILSSQDRGLRLKVSECRLVDFDQRMLQVWALRYVRAQPLDPLTVTECRL